MAVIIGCDPGGTTGLILRADARLLAHSVLSDRVLVASMLALWASDILDHPPVDLVAIEDVTPPNPHLGTISVGGLLTTAKMFGYVLAICRQLDLPVVVVPPGGHGSDPYHTYPERLRPKIGGKGHDRLRHARSAWSISYAGEAEMRLRQART